MTREVAFADFVIQQAGRLEQSWTNVNERDKRIRALLNQGLSIVDIAAKMTPEVTQTTIKRTIHNQEKQRKRDGENLRAAWVLPPDQSGTVLQLILRKKWFDMIASGIKSEEYREIKPHWIKRLTNRGYDFVRFRNGYGKNAPQMVVELMEIVTGFGVVDWGAPSNEQVYIIRLGAIIHVTKVLMSAAERTISQSEWTPEQLGKLIRK